MTQRSPLFDARAPPAHTAKNQFNCWLAAAVEAAISQYSLPPYDVVSPRHFCRSLTLSWTLNPFIFAFDNNSHMVNTAQQENIFVWHNLILFSNHLYFTYIQRWCESAGERVQTVAPSPQTHRHASSTSFCVNVNDVFAVPRLDYFAAQRRVVPNYSGSTDGDSNGDADSVNDSNRKEYATDYTHSQWSPIFTWYGLQYYLPNNSAILSTHLKYIWFIFLCYFSGFSATHWIHGEEFRPIISFSH